jgi:hypothetical protein
MVTRKRRPILHRCIRGDKKEGLHITQMVTRKRRPILHRCIRGDKTERKRGSILYDALGMPRERGSICTQLGSTLHDASGFLLGKEVRSAVPLD